VREFRWKVTYKCQVLRIEEPAGFPEISVVRPEGKFSFPDSPQTVPAGRTFWPEGKTTCPSISVSFPAISTVGPAGKLASRSGRTRFPAGPECEDRGRMTGEDSAKTENRCVKVRRRRRGSQRPWRIVRQPLPVFRWGWRDVRQP
jgi:hypothetical protein